MTVQRSNTRRTAGYHLIGIVLSVLCAGPILLIAWKSLQPGGTLTGLTLNNYTSLFGNPRMTQWLVNSLLVAVVTTVLTVLVDLPAAYVFARIPFRGRNALFLLLLATIMLPSALTLIPTYLLAVRYDLINTYAGLILPALAAPLGIFLLRQYILGLPNELFEAARVDGAGHFRVLRSIVVPLVRQPIIVLAVLTTVTSWNAFIWPLLIGQQDSRKTLPVGIATQNLQFVNDIGLAMAQAVVSVIPIALLFACVQRAFTSGLTAGAVK